MALVASTNAPRNPGELERQRSLCLEQVGRLAVLEERLSALTRRLGVATERPVVSSLTSSNQVVEESALAAMEAALSRFSGLASTLNDHVADLEKL